MDRPDDPREELLDRAVAWFARHGVGNTSMRTLAAALGTSGRMLNYHFGSREDLLRSVVLRVERDARDVLHRMLAEEPDPYRAGAAFWSHLADAAEVFAPLFFELSSHAMLGQRHARPLRDWLTDGWIAEGTATYRHLGVPEPTAGDLARSSVAMTRGLLFDLAITGDRATADRCMAGYRDQVRATIEALTGRPRSPARPSAIGDRPGHRRPLDPHPT